MKLDFKDDIMLQTADSEHKHWMRQMCRIVPYTFLLFLGFAFLVSVTSLLQV